MIKAVFPHGAGCLLGMGNSDGRQAATFAV